VRKRFSLVVVVAALVVVAFPSPSSAADVNGCTASVDNPHYSSGARGVIVKARFSCTKNAVYINQFLKLWWCGEKQPQKNKNWLASNCANAGTNNHDIDGTTAGVTYTRYAPTSFASTTRGWYIGRLEWESTKGTTKSTVHVRFSPGAYYYS
jgi:hypothetical protein